MDTLILENHLKTVSTYRAAIRAAGRGYWAGALDVFQFFDAMNSAIEINFPRAWLEGLKKVGIGPDEMTLEEELTLRRAIVHERGYIEGLATFIEQNSQANKGKLQVVFQRLERWLQRYQQLTNQAMAMAGKDKKLQWVVTATESCRSCLRLAGKVKRASQWAAAGLRPQAGQLECVRNAKGIPVCKCYFQVTDLPLTRGALPRI